MYGDSVLGYNRIKMNERLVFTLLLCVVGVLWCIIGYWRLCSERHPLTTAFHHKSQHHFTINITAEMP